MSTPGAIDPYDIQRYYQAPFSGGVPTTGAADFLELVLPGAYKVTLVPRYPINEHIKFVGEDELKPLIEPDANMGPYWYYIARNCSDELLQKIRSDRGVRSVWWHTLTRMELLDGEGEGEEGAGVRAR
jgi:hypothetical protein